MIIAIQYYDCDCAFIECLFSTYANQTDIMRKYKSVKTNKQMQTAKQVVNCYVLSCYRSN